MKELDSTNYFHLVSKIPAGMQPPLAEFSLGKENGILEFTAGNLIVRLTPCWKNSKMEGEPDSIILDAELMKLDLNNREVNHDRFLILHQFNSVSRYATGMISFITEQGMLSLGKMISMPSLSEKENVKLLLEEIATMVAAANDLYDQWNELNSVSSIG
ncbi:MAG: hypothetical protein K2W97_06970 [Chthoniobacterales bacterium]|nr:hypothetical protein [Chthoniobacterales bacterium]